MPFFTSCFLSVIAGFLNHQPSLGGVLLFWRISRSLLHRFVFSHLTSFEQRLRLCLILLLTTHILRNSKSIATNICLGSAETKRLPYTLSLQEAPWEPSDPTLMGFQISSLLRRREHDKEGSWNIAPNNPRTPTTYLFFSCTINEFTCKWNNFLKISN